MERSNLKYLYTFILIFLTGCSSEMQMSSYNPPEGGETWSVNVIEKSSITKFMPEFICVINDSAVIKESFPVSGGRTFVKKGKYRGKTIIMNGYKKSVSTGMSYGTESYENFYQIRLLIDGELIDTFQF